MKKTKGISKYDLDWQMIRVGIKGKMNDNNSIVSKLEIVRNYFEETLTYDRWERVFNWLEGYWRGIKKSIDVFGSNLIKEEFAYYNRVKPQQTESVIENDFLKYSEKDRLLLLKDLFKTNKGWLEKGYFHHECNSFLEKLYSSLPSFVIPYNYSYESLLILQSNSHLKTNKYKFFF